MKQYLTPFVSPSLALTVVFYILFVLFRFGFYWLYDFPIPMDGVCGKLAETIIPSSSLPANAISCLIVIINSMVIAQMNNRFAIIRSRTFMPTFIYLLISLFWLPSYGDYISIFGSLLVLLAVYFTLGMYKDKNSVEQAFLTMFFLALSSVMVPEYVVLIAVFWIAFLLFNCFSIRVFFASIFGFLTPWILITATLYFIFGNVNFVIEFKDTIFEYWAFNNLYVLILVFLVIMGLILVLSLLQIYSKMQQDNIQTRRMLSFFRLIVVALLLLLILSSDLISYYPLLSIFYAYLTGYVFTLFRNRFNAIVFLSLCISNILISLIILVV